MAANGESTHNGGRLQAAKNTAINIFKWIARAALILVGAAIAVALDHDDMGTALALVAAGVGTYGVFKELTREYPLPTAGMIAFVVINKRHAIATLAMAFVVFSIFATNVAWRASFTYAVIVSLAYWFFIMAMVFKYKPLHMVLLMAVLLGIVVKGAIDLLGEHSIALPTVAHEPHVLLYGVAALLGICLGVREVHAFNKSLVKKEQIKKKKRENMLTRYKEEGDMKAYEDAKKLFRREDLAVNPRKEDEERTERVMGAIAPFLLLVGLAALIDWKFLP